MSDYQEMSDYYKTVSKPVVITQQDEAKVLRLLGEPPTMQQLAWSSHIVDALENRSQHEPGSVPGCPLCQQEKSP